MSKSKAIEVLESGLAEARERLLLAEAEVRDFEAALRQLSSGAYNYGLFSSPAGSNRNGHTYKHAPQVGVFTAHKKESLRKAVVRVLRTENKFLHIKEIMTILKDDINFKDIEADQISRTLTNLKSGDNLEGLVTHREGLMANTFWGFEYFFTPEGNIKGQHMYNQDSIATTISRQG